MVWHSPFTFTAGNQLTADQLNQYLYDNMQETLIGKLKGGSLSNTEGQWFSSDGVNSVVGRQVRSVASSGTGWRTSTSYGTPTSSAFGYVNPTITMTTGTMALVLWSCLLNVEAAISSNTISALVSVAVSGASSIAANDTYATRNTGITGTAPAETLPTDNMTFRWYDGLTPGTNTFTIQGRCTSSFQIAISTPTLIVIPFG